MSESNDEPREEDLLDGGEDLFWSRLCSELERAGAASAHELSEAEQLLAGLDEAEAQPLGAQKVEDLQRAALDMADPRSAAELRDDGRGDVARSAAGPERVGPHEPTGGSGVPAPVLAGRFRRYVAAAAAVMLAPKFLAAAALVTVAAATTGYFLRNTTQNLLIPNAAQILMDEGADEAARSVAQGTVTLNVVEVLRVIRVLDGGPPELRGHADAVRAELRALLLQQPRFIHRRFDASLDELIADVLDRGADEEARHEALSGLAAQLRYGVTALLAVRPMLTPSLLEQNDVCCAKLRQLLE
ncbi:MAG: hypothetical protein H6835_08280 [Planctomycetes bacterium]|nr:hypothetical protein [Planctomycetota bacterium]